MRGEGQVARCFNVWVGLQRTRFVDFIEAVAGEEEVGW